MLLKAAHGDRECASQMYSDVAIERIHRIFELWDGVRPLENYAFNAIRWYAYKYVNKRRPAQFDEDFVPPTYTQESHLDALDALSETERYLIASSVFYGLSVRDIAAELGWSMHATTQALQYAKDNVRMMYDDWAFVKSVIGILT